MVELSVSSLFREISEKFPRRSGLGLLGLRVYIMLQYLLLQLRTDLPWEVGERAGERNVYAGCPQICRARGYLNDVYVSLGPLR